MSKSRYIHTTRTYLPRHRRSKQLYGSFEDSGKWYKCWNCGFPFDISKHAFGSGKGTSCEDFPVTYEEMGHSTVLGVEGNASIMQNGADGTAITRYYTPRKATVIGGCPFCGCKNQP